MSEGEIEIENKVKKEMQIEDMEEYNKKQKKKGVCYMSRIPPYMSPSTLKKYLTNYRIERIYLHPESDKRRLSRVK